MMRNLIGPRIQMKFPVVFYVLCFFFSAFFGGNSAEEHLKIFKKSNNIFDRSNWVNPNLKQDCRKVEFGETNSAEIDVQHLVAEDYELPIDGDLDFKEGSSLKIVDHNSKIQTNCLKLKELHNQEFLNPKNWESDVADNPAVPDREKLPCRDDRIQLPEDADFFITIPIEMGDYLVSEITYGNTSSWKSRTVALGNSARLLVYERQCRSAAGCICNDIRNDIECDVVVPPCEHPIHPKGFCNPICGAFITFKPLDGFSLKKVQESLKDYSDVSTHASKIDDDVIQVVFAEKEYTGDSVSYAEDFFEKLKKGSAEFKITDLKELKKSGSRTTGGSSFFTVLLSSLLFVLGIFALIFGIYGDRRWLTNLRFRNTTSFPLTSSYRARFSSRDDESGLIDTHSIAGSVLNLRQSFDNPMFGDVSALKDGEEEKANSNEVGVPQEKISEKNDPLFDLKKLNEELQEEIGSDVVENLQEVVNFKAAMVNDFPPLIEVDEGTED